MPPECPRIWRRMAVFVDLLKQMANMQWSDYLDILLVAYVIYRLMHVIPASAMRILRVVVAVVVLDWVTDIANLHAMNFILDQLLTVGALALVVLFQPELRHMMDHLGNVKIKDLVTTQEKQQATEVVINQTVLACEVMSREKIGALIVFSRKQRLEDLFRTGTVVDAAVSEQLIRNIFFPKAALHDGAMIIADDRVAAAGCVLPLSESDRLSADLGTRHRAGIGVSEATDAVVVIVSEETGTISVAMGGMLKRHLAPQTLERLLRQELCPDVPVETGLKVRLQQRLQKEKGADHEKE